MEAFRAVNVVEDFGLFWWNITKSGDEVTNDGTVSDMQWNKVLERLEMAGKPKYLMNLEQLNKMVAEKEIRLFRKNVRGRLKDLVMKLWSYPYTIPPPIICHVASERGCDMKQVHFLVHGTVLGYLSRARSKSKKETILVQRLGGSNIMNIRVIVDSNSFLGDLGHQFESFVVGDNPFQTDNLILQQHLRLLQIGSHKILVCAEADAVLPQTTTPVEVKMQDPMNETTAIRDKVRILLQMISTGSESLVTMERIKEDENNSLIKEVKQYTLSELLESQEELPNLLNERIGVVDQNLTHLKNNIKGNCEDCYELTFNEDGMLINVYDANDGPAISFNHEFQMLCSKMFETNVCKSEPPEVVQACLNE